MTTKGDKVTPPEGCGHPGVFQMCVEDDTHTHWLNCPSRELLSAEITAKLSVMRPLEPSEGANTDR